MHAPLPTRLGSEPLIEVVFEMRFESEVPASDILPGYLFKGLSASKIERLNLAEIPKPIRDGDQNLRFSPIIRVHGENIDVSIGDRVVVVNCILPYPGWEMFREKIQEVLEIISDVGVIRKINRYSLKYVDFIPGETIKDQISKVSIDMRVAGHELVDQLFNLRIEIPDDDVLHLLTIVPSAQVTKEHNKEIRSGVVIDVDSIVNVGSLTFLEWHVGLNEKLDDLHEKNKRLFFSSITDATLNELEPYYV